MDVGLMELRRLAYFVTVVEKGGFRAAAATLRVTQPPLTRQIQLLEASLGVRLLVRRADGVDPTAAGRLLFEEAKNLLALAHRAADRVRRTAHGLDGRLDVGVFGSVMLGVVPTILRKFAEKYPQVVVTLHSLDRAEQLLALRERRIDLGFTRFLSDEPDLYWEVVHSERLSVMVSHDHRLASSQSIGLHELASEALILYPRQPRAGSFDRLMQIFHQQKLSPASVREVDDLLTATALVAANFGVTVLTGAGRNIQIPGTAHVELEGADAAAVDLCLIRRKAEDNPLVENFYDIARASHAVTRKTLARRSKSSRRR